MFGPLIELIDCQSLYNILNEGIEYAKICDPYYLYLLDCRPRSDYNESHIICAKHVKKNDDESSSFRLPYEAELQSRNLIVVYDGKTSSLDENGLATECAKIMSENGSKFSVKILKGGYEAFSRHYPFLRTQQIIYMPKEMDELRTYPSEIIPGLLYLGNLRHGTQPYIKKDLKLKSYIDCTNSDEGDKFKDEKSIDFYKIRIEDDEDESIEEYLEQACNFIDVNIKNRKQPCLVFSNLGISRSAAIVIAYLVYSEKLSVQEAFDKVNKCKKIQPQMKFLIQIAQKYGDKEFEANNS